MEKLFEDKETFQSERPKRITEQQKTDFYLIIAKEIVNDGYVTDTTFEDIAEDLEKIGIRDYDNGYEIAKKLDDDCGYSIDPMFVDFLDTISHRLRNIHEDNVKDWVKAKQPKPIFSVGDCVKINKMIGWNKELKDGEAFITGIQKETAQYLIHKDKGRKGGFVVDFEIVENCCTPNS